MAANIKNLYFGNAEISKETVQKFIKLSGDHMFFGGTEIVVREMEKSGTKVYRYMYSHRGSITLVDTFLLNTAAFMGKLLMHYLTGYKLMDYQFGTCHADEMFVMFQPHQMPFSSLISEQDKVASDRMLKTFINFIT